MSGFLLHGSVITMPRGDDKKTEPLINLQVLHVLLCVGAGFDTQHRYEKRRSLDKKVHHPCGEEFTANKLPHAQLVCLRIAAICDLNRTLTNVSLL